MTRLAVTDLPLHGLKRVTRQRLGDPRGFLSRLFCADELNAAGWHKPVAQINQTHTEHRGTVRGLHFQYPPHTETKLVSCLQGEVWDLALDLRAGSPTFLRWHAERLSADNCTALLIPPGFAHGFQTLTDNVVLLYCHDQPHISASEGGLDALDPRLAINWPLPVLVRSSRDQCHPPLTHQFEGLAL
jgi:dTDP-4-dehydrorhamnose 3,5-epimerase